MLCCPASPTRILALHLMKLHMYFALHLMKIDMTYGHLPFFFHDEARVPPGLETGKHFVGWQSCSSVKEM